MALFHGHLFILTSGNDEIVLPLPFHFLFHSKHSHFLIFVLQQFAKSIHFRVRIRFRRIPSIIHPIYRRLTLDFLYVLVCFKCYIEWVRFEELLISCALLHSRQFHIIYYVHIAHRSGVWKVCSFGLLRHTYVTTNTACLRSRQVLRAINRDDDFLSVQLLFQAIPFSSR